MIVSGEGWPIRGDARVTCGVASTRQAHRAGRAGLLDLVGQAHFAAQRDAAMDCSGVREARAPASDVAHVSAHLRLVVTRQGCTGQGGREVDGTYERGRDAQRVHASDG